MADKTSIGMAMAVLAFVLATSDAADSNSRRAGRAFFSQHVLPRLVDNGCPKCHAVGYVHPNVLIYDELLPYLAMGDSPEKSDVIKKIANLRAIAPDRPTHPGGQRCPTLDAEPCKSILEWWHVEFDQNGGPALQTSPPGGQR